jgi:phosphate-selective porin OprO/OprP
MMLRCAFVVVCITAVSASGAQDTKKDDTKDKPTVVHWDEGVHITGPGERLKIKIGGSVQNDTTGFARTEDIETELGSLDGGVQWRRARLYLDGLFAEHFEFKFQYDFASRSPPHLKDAYVGLRNLPLPVIPLDVRAGRFRAPLSLEGYTAANNTTFLERGLISAFLPSRNTGIMFHGDSPQHRIRWNVAFVQEEDDFGIDISRNASLTARFASAFKPKNHLLHVGFDYSRRNADEDGTLRFLERPEAHLAPQFVDTGAFAAESVQNGMLEGAFVRGPLSIQGEYARAFVKAEDVGNPEFYAFYVFVSYFLTGETRPYNTDRGSFGRPRPKHDFRGSSKGTGALEIAFRFSRADLKDGAIDGGELNDFTAAFNWYPTHETRVMFNAILANRKGYEAVGIFQVRLQVAF